MHQTLWVQDAVAAASVLDTAALISLAAAFPRAMSSHSRGLQFQIPGAGPQACDNLVTKFLEFCLSKAEQYHRALLPDYTWKNVSSFAS